MKVSENLSLILPVQFVHHSKSKKHDLNFWRRSGTSDRNHAVGATSYELLLIAFNICSQELKSFGFCPRKLVKVEMYDLKIWRRSGRAQEKNSAYIDVQANHRVFRRLLNAFTKEAFRLCYFPHSPQVRVLPS